MVIGRNGQVVRALAERAGTHASAHQFAFIARPQLDLAAPEAIPGALAGQTFDILVNAAAFTAVDAAEEQEELARTVNAVAPGVLAAEAARRGAPIIHLSTDYVFDGSGDRPWREDDPVAPLNVYGTTKLEGEDAVRRHAPAHHLILRTAWVYSPFGSNFLKTMLRLAADRDELRVVADQIGNPTSAYDIADAILAIIDCWSQGADHASTGLGRTYHVAGTGEASWCDFARAIFAQSARLGGPSASVVGIPSEAYVTKARRPGNSRLDCHRFAADFSWQAPAWGVSLQRVLQRLMAPMTRLEA
nr:dTDP-4-dehydrorhamnose reductase [Pseudohoeflea sp. DP4N28-3]